jgi:penicillin amidase
MAFAAFTDIIMARDFEDLEAAVHEIDTNHTLIAADVDGNIGYWLTGRFPKRHPSQDPRLPTPGTGERDWQGFVRLSKLVSCINPPEGWLSNFNQKPSVKTPGWWPEIMWGKRINDILAANNPIDWETFLSINKANGIHHMVSPIAEDYLIPLLREQGADDPRIVQALALIEQWECVDVPGVPGALIFSEWLMEFMMEALSVDFAPFVQRNLQLGNLQLFGALLYRILLPEKSGVELMGDYLHGRDRDALALDCFRRVLAQLGEKHGADMSQWPYEPATMVIGALDSFPTRACGTYWMATELSQPMRSIDMLVPGASGQERSPHFKDQIALFMDWKLRPTPFTRADFPVRP